MRRKSQGERLGKPRSKARQAREALGTFGAKGFFRSLLGRGTGGPFNQGDWREVEEEFRAVRGFRGSLKVFKLLEKRVKLCDGI